MQTMIDGVPVEFADSAGLAFVPKKLEGSAAHIESLQKQLADAKRKDGMTPKYSGKGGEGQNEASGGQEDEDPDGD